MLATLNFMAKELMSNILQSSRLFATAGAKLFVLDQIFLH